MAEIKKYLDTTALGALVDQIKAEDAKALAAAKKYTDDAGKLYDAAGAAATAKSEAIADANAKFETVNAEVAKKATTEALEAEVKRSTEEDAILAGLIEGVEGKADKNAEDIAAINNADTGILAQAKAFATAEDAKVQGAVDAVVEKIGEVPTDKTVKEYIDDKTAGIATDAALAELQGAVDAVEADVDTIKGDYLKSADKTTLQGNIDTLAQTHATDKAAIEASIKVITDDYLKAADKTELQGKIDAVSAVANAAVKQADYDVKVKALADEDVRIADLVATEAERAAGVEADHEERLVEVEAFFKLAEGEQLDTALDTLKEIQTYITSEGAAADQMVLDIAANKKAIEDHVATNHDFAGADATLKAELVAEIAKKADKTTVEGIDGRLTIAEGKVTTLEGDMTQAKKDIDAVEEAVSTKAEAQALTEAIAALEGADAGLAGRLQVVETQLGDGEGSVADQIEDAKQAAIAAAAADATTKANTAETNAKTHADGLNTAMNARVEALEAIDHEHANKELLDTYTQTNADLADAVAKKHEHANKAVLDGITAEKVTAWDAAEGNAKTYADGLNTAMTTKVDGVDARVKTLETTIVDKAEKDDLDAAVERIAANESAIAANTSAINSFTAITADEVNALFA